MVYRVKRVKESVGKGEVITTTNKSNKIVHKLQKYISVVSLLLMALMMSAVTVYAEGGAAASGQPANVDTSTMGELGTIVWWIVRIVILAVGAIPGGINLVQGLNDQDNRQRNIGLTVLVVTGAVFAATFAFSSIIGF